MYEKRKTFCVVFLIILIALMSILFGCKTSTSGKNPILEIEKDVYIYDEDKIIEEDVKTKLNEFLVQLEEKAGAEFVVISVKSLLDESIEDYAKNLFHALGTDKKEDRIVLLVFSWTDKKLKMEASKDLKDCLNGVKWEQILNDYFIPYCEEEEYTKATEMTIRAVLNVLTKEYKIEIQGLEPLNGERLFSIIMLMFFTIVGVMIFVVLHFKESQKKF